MKSTCIGRRSQRGVADLPRRDLLECRVDIRLKHGYKQDSQANAGRGSHLRNQQANGSQDLQETGEKDDLAWIGNGFGTILRRSSLREVKWALAVKRSITDSAQKG